MDDQLFSLLMKRFDSQEEMIKNRSDAQDTMLQSIATNLQEHTGKDERYWKKIDDQYAQMRLVKWLGGSGVGVSLAAWLWQKLGH